MLRILFLIIIFSPICLKGQLKKYYSIEDNDAYDTVTFSLSAASGTSYIRTSNHGDPLEIYGNPQSQSIHPSFFSKINNGNYHLSLDLENYNSSSLTQTISYNIMNSGERKQKNYWKFYLTKDKIYDLDLKYGFGSSNIDLSGVPISNFKVNTGSADVFISYQDHLKNLCSMDTFMVEVDLGTLVTEKISLSRARHVVAKIGFGSATLDFSTDVTEKCDIKATVGAGGLVIILPKNPTPIEINIHNSPLCNVEISKEFEEVEKNTYVNREYSAHADNLMTFDVDVALGNIVFR